MLVIAMIFAACWGVLQLAALGWVSRSISILTLLAAVGAGFYGCGLVAVAVEYVYAHAVSAGTGQSLYEVVQTAAYTSDPFVEEFTKMLPLVVAGLYLRTRKQCGLTDYLLLGAALGAGFGLLEGVLRFGGDAARAIEVDGVWLLPRSLSPPMIPTPTTALTSWLPAVADSSDFFALTFRPSTNLHLAWSAVAGLGVGITFRGRGPVRLLGPALVTFVGGAHASYNYHLANPVGASSGAGVLAAPFVAVQNTIWLWPAVALAVAVSVDRRVLARMRLAAPQVMLRGERAGAPATFALRVTPPSVRSRRRCWCSGSSGCAGPPSTPPPGRRPALTDRLRRTPCWTTSPSFAAGWTPSTPRVRGEGSAYDVRSTRCGWINQRQIGGAVGCAGVGRYCSGLR